MGHGAEGTAVDFGDVVGSEGTEAERAAAESAALGAEGAGDLRLLVPLEATEHLAKVFAVLEGAQVTGLHGVSGFGLVSTTLDEVFCRLGEEGELSRRRQERLDTKHHRQQQAAADYAAYSADANDLEAEAATTLLAGGGEEALLDGEASLVKPGLTAKLRLMLGRRFRSEARNSYSALVQLLAPLVMVGATIALLKASYY